jgi:hypothetical protein
LLLTVLFATVVAPPALMPPPSAVYPRSLTELPVTVELVRIVGPTLLVPPPIRAVQPCTVTWSR